MDKTLLLMRRVFALLQAPTDNPLMKIPHLALFALLAAFTAGCAPKNGPSGYENGEQPSGPSGPSPAPAGPEVGQNPNLPVRPSDKQLPPPDRIPKEAIALVVHFGFDKYTVEAGERAKIDAVVASLKGKKLILAGYSDHFGTDAYNLGLSDKRAHSVEKYLESSGVTENDVRAFGEQYANKSGDKSAVSDDRKVIVVDPSKL